MARGGGARAAMQARKAKQDAAAAAAPEKKKKPKKKERRPSRVSVTEEGDGPVTCAAFLHACPVVVGVWGLGHINACRGVGLRRDMRWM